MPDMGSPESEDLRSVLGAWLRRRVVRFLAPASDEEPLVETPPQVPGEETPRPAGPALEAELYRVARGVVALMRLGDDVSFRARVVAVRRELFVVASEYDHPDLVPLLVLAVGDYAASAFMLGREVEADQRDRGGEPEGEGPS